MLETLQLASVEELMPSVVPSNIYEENTELPDGVSEKEALDALKKMMSANKLNKNLIGNGYYETIVPSVILRNFFENPGWYTPYTPYQAEISQGRLEMLLNFQTMISDLTGFPVANASLLDEATAAAEAAVMTFNVSNKKKRVFLVSSDCNPQTIAVVKTRAEGMGGIVNVSHHSEFDFSDKNVCGVLVQYPTTFGHVEDYADFCMNVHANGALVVVATDLLALTVLKPPGEFGADIAVGSSQRFGIPLGFGGPHAAFLATAESYKRKIPGRLIGMSIDTNKKPALRMAMQTREQHIRRDRATSNICTAQALLANMAACFGVYHGPEGIRDIALRTHGFARVFERAMLDMGYKVRHNDFFDTVIIDIDDGTATDLFARVDEAGYNLRLVDDSSLGVAFDEATNETHLADVLGVFAAAKSVSVPDVAAIAESMDPASLLPASLQRSSTYMTHPVFNTHRSETEMMRYLQLLQNKDLSLQTSMIPLGSCTMKLNAASEMIPVSWPEVANLHPFCPPSHAQGYAAMIADMERYFLSITGFDNISFQPNSGSQGEYSGLMTIMEYHRAQGDTARNVCLIPTSAHGTNPASAVIAGMKVVVIGCDERGNIDMDDLRAKAAKYEDELAAAMITYPSTHGVFEQTIKEACAIVHEHGGQVYMDGANLNAQVGFCTPAGAGADVCHLNLHKTFCIPHGGGGPGMGPIGVRKHLAPFLPSHPLWETGGDKTSSVVAAAPFSSASILPISYMFVKMMGREGLKSATQIAVLNANYMAKRLEKEYKILYRGESDLVAHEFIVDLRPFKILGIVEEDIAKRLMDYNFHGPTMSWPVPGTLMIEPTESESLVEMDRFCDAMLHIREEIRQIEVGAIKVADSPLKHAPHTAETVMSSTWDRQYSREDAVYPLRYLRDSKFWPSVSRIDNVYGDRNVVCTCPPLSDYE